MRIALVLLAVLQLTACTSIEEATGHTPIIDTQGVDLARYDDDLSQCRSYADEVQIGRQTATAAAAGAAVGGAVGAVLGNSGTAQRGAGVGAIAGTTRGVSGGLRDRERVISNCLRGRGYRVLN